MFTYVQSRAAAVVSRRGRRGAMLLHTRRLILGLLCIVLGASLFGASSTRAQATDTVYIIPINETIDLGLAPYLNRVIQQADQENIRAIVLEINTPGGRLDAALQMRDALLGAETPTVAFINREAFSAGALIAIAADEIYMAPGAVIGSATPVDAAGETADAKTISAVRSTFQATAETRGRDPQVAEAMVDPAIAIDGLIASGDLLALTTEQAQQVGYADGVASNRAELLETLGFAQAQIEEPGLSPAEGLVRLLTNPAVASILISLGFLLIYADILSGGFGLIGGVGILLFVIFFWGHFLAGLAGWEGVTLVLIGLVLIAFEIFIIPGFGIAGILGIVSLLGGLYFSMIGREIVTAADVQRAGYTILGTFILMIGGAVLLMRLLPRSRAMQGMILQSQVGIPSTERAQRRRWEWLQGARLEPTMPATGDTQRISLRGATGVALSDLRPGGFATIAGERIDVVTQGDYIRAGEAIQVVSDEGYRRVVRRVPSPVEREQITENLDHDA